MRKFSYLISRKTAQIVSNEQKCLTFCSLLAILQTNLWEKPIFFANAYDFLAKKLGISEVYLRKLFSVHYGTSPRQFIIDMRIQKAKSLLTNGTHTITSISEECGFSSLYHFCRTFKDKTGMTPTEYAKNGKIYQI